VDFVYKTLFPYASRKLESFILEHFREPEITSLIRQLHMQHDVDDRQGLQPPSWIDEQGESRLRSCIEFCKWLMAKDSKATPLKSLQGKIWEAGYVKGELQGEVYPDVPPAFTRWRLQRREICIYSSGSVLSQQLLFHSIPSGDLTPLIAAFFDTRVGAKTETESYLRIAQSLTRSPHNFLFISDVVKEVVAANDAGMQAILCNRDVHASQSQEPNILIHSFDEILSE
jgi:enolase-phosphatase E1